jgi:hypothetical protein
LLPSSELQRCEQRLSASPLAAAAAGFNVTETGLPDLPMHMLARGLDALVPDDGAERQRVESRGCALLLQANECGGDHMPTAFGSLAVPIVLAIPPPRRPHGEDVQKEGFGTVEPSATLSPLKHPLEPVAVGMLLRAHAHGVSEALRAAAAANGTQAILQERWPRLLRHLHSICSRADLADVTRRKQGAQPPAETLQRVVEEEWLTHAFVGALSRNTLMWVWDQFALQGWSLAAEVAACAFWLIRREVRRLDAASAGATELKGAMTAQLRQEGEDSLQQLQALLAATSSRTREDVAAKSVASQAKPQVMLRLPMVLVHDPKAVKLKAVRSLSRKSGP